MKPSPPKRLPGEKRKPFVNDPYGMPLRLVPLTARQRRVLLCMIRRENTGLGESQKAAVISQIVDACSRAGAESELLDVLGLDLLSVSLSLQDCMTKATRPGGRDVGEVDDYATRHAATRTALELRRKIGSQRDKQAGSFAVQPGKRRTGTGATAILGPGRSVKLAVAGSTTVESTDDDPDNEPGNVPAVDTSREPTE